jgi:hypothetical protein
MRDRSSPIRLKALGYITSPGSGAILVLTNWGGAAFWNTATKETDYERRPEPSAALMRGHGFASAARVRLSAGERWRYEPPRDHDVLWIAVGPPAPARTASSICGALPTSSLPRRNIWPATKSPPPIWRLPDLCRP